jgi:hypothetical protein
MVSTAADATPQRDCKPTSISSVVLDGLSQPLGNAMDSETGDARWEQAQAIAERDREYSAIERQHDDQAYQVASHLIDAQFAIADAEIAQVVSYDVQGARKEFAAARHEVNSALQLALPKQRPPLVTLWDHLQRAELGATLCHGLSRGEERYEYETLKASFRQTIRAI